MGDKDDQVSFHGFGDGDSVKCAVEAKVAKVREFQIQRQLPPIAVSSATSNGPSALPSRGPRNFLKLNVKSSKPVNGNTSSCTSLFPPRPVLHPAASPATPVGGYRRAQQNKFLKLKTSCPRSSPSSTPTTAPSPNIAIAAPSPKSTDLIENITSAKIRLAVADQKEAKVDPAAPTLHHLPPKLFQQNGLSSSSEEEDMEMPSLKKNRADPPLTLEQKPLVSSKKSNKKAAFVNIGTPREEEPSSKKPTPAKRTITSKSTPELSFLPGQSSRSKRTIVPNKRFLSVDSPPPSVAEPPQVSPCKPSRKSEISSKKRAASVGGRDLPVPATTATNRKRKPSSGTHGVENTNGAEEFSSLQKPVKVPVNVRPSATSPPAGVETSCSLANGGRPRRTIIPNRKFQDEDATLTVSPATPPYSQVTSVVPQKNISPPNAEPPKQKRRISAPKHKKQQQNGIALSSSSASSQKIPPPIDPPQMIASPSQGAQLVFPLGGKLSGNSGGVATQRAEDISESALAAVMEVDFEEIPSAATATAVTAPPLPPQAEANMEPDDNISSIEKSPPTENQDELALEETEQKMFAGKPIFLGACILKDVDQNGGDAQKVSGGIIYCGICSRVKKYRVIPEKRRRGSFLCSECTQIVSKIFQTAMKARPFDCILGPPVCEGSCPLELSPPGLFCQACFAKTCLRNLPMKDDIYFKIWRSIPPMSRGCVPTTPPTSNPHSPYVGKVVYVKFAAGDGDASGSPEIRSSTGSLKMFGSTCTAAGTAKKKATGASSPDALTDSISTSELVNGDDDLNSARITTFSNHCGTGGVTGTNRENAIPSSSSLNLTDRLLIKSTSSNGVILQSHEEILLVGRQTGLKAEEAPHLPSVQGGQVDPLYLKGEALFEFFGFPVICSTNALKYPPPKKPLCFLCGSAGIEQMMECCKCNRWIHASCENLDDDQYQIVGRLPECIEYICKLCHKEVSPSTKPLWYEAIGSLLAKECNSVVRSFEQKCLGTATLLRRRSSSIDLITHKKPSYVCNLFGGGIMADEKEVPFVDLTQTDEELEEEQGGFGDDASSCQSGTSTPTTVVSSFGGDSGEDEEDITSYTPPRPQVDFDVVRIALRRASKVTSRQLLDCKVKLRDFVKHPASLEENWWALKVMGVEVLNENKNKAGKLAVTPVKMVKTSPILDRTPQRKIICTPSKVVTEITSALRRKGGSGGGWKSLRVFWREFMSAVEEAGGDQSEAIFEKAKEAFEKSFPWFNPGANGSPEEMEEEQERKSEGDGVTMEEDPFREVYWDIGDFFDERPCVLCGEIGDFPPESCGRLLWCGLNEWIHCNCAIWSSEVWELESGALQQVGGALNRGRSLRCKICGGKGATVSCCHSSCKNSYHFKCALEGNCWLLMNKTMFCEHHKLSGKQKEGIQTKEDMKVARKVYVDLEWIQKRGLKADSGQIQLFIGSMKVTNFGQILAISCPETGRELVPCGFQSQRIFWKGDANDPWAKATYFFGTAVDSNGFDDSLKTFDPGVNITVKHAGNVQKGLQSIHKFHKWLAKATRYVDENKVEWLVPCPLKAITLEEDDENIESGIDVFENYNKGRSSPSSVSSFGSFVGGHNGGLTRGHGVKRKQMCGDTDTEGYVSSIDSFNETPRSSKQVKRRRRSSPKKAARGGGADGSSSCTNSSKLESPRRRSLRNSRQLPSVAPDDSDNDSGVNDTPGWTIPSCRLNLLSLFNEGFEGVKEEEEQGGPGITDGPKFSQSANEEIEMPEGEDKDGNKTYKASVKFQLMHNNEIVSFRDDPRDCWNFMFEKICKSRHENGLGKLIHPALHLLYKSENLSETANSLRMLGVSHPNVQYIAEQLPGISNVLSIHKFQYSRKPHCDDEDEDVRGKCGMGSSRCEGFQGRKPFDMFGWLANKHRKVAQLMSTFEPEGSRVQGLPLAMQFRDLKEKAKRKFVVLHSVIHGRGLFSRCDVEKGEMLVEYAGEVIRPVLSDPRERYYESKGIGCYMFRCKGQVIDATMTGNAARFINHSCEPNCEAKTVRILGKDHIIIFALRKIWQGEELTYDYKFEREENKIPCSCGASRCRKYMN